jgi:SAM-dependent methyltransferase
METPGSSGTGPGVITPDGCAVDFYALLPPGDDPGIIQAAIPGGASILELGCGTGRVTSALAALGHPIVAVDESAEMLAHVRGADTVQAVIQDLRLGRRFDVVLLASHLINVPDDEIRRALLRTGAEHVTPNGCVIIQQHPPAWFASAGPSQRTSADGMTFRLRDVTRPGPGLVAATVVYEVGSRIWTQSFTARQLGDEFLRACLREAGLALDAYVTDDHGWLRAVPG